MQKPDINTLETFVAVAEDLAAGRLRVVLEEYRARPLTLSAVWRSRQFVPKGQGLRGFSVGRVVRNKRVILSSRRKRR
ncbi:MAG: hypothetical protein U9Q81_12965 [Pseudomonadota bacterium]|nr:hypothetical protein [Pseudomonadota bacterium]